MALKKPRERVYGPQKAKLKDTPDTSCVQPTSTVAESGLSDCMKSSLLSVLRSPGRAGEDGSIGAVVWETRP